MTALLKFMATDLGFANEVRIAGWITRADRLIADGMEADAAAAKVGVPPATMRAWRAKLAMADRKSPMAKLGTPGGRSLPPPRQVEVPDIFK